MTRAFRPTIGLLLSLAFSLAGFAVHAQDDPASKAVTPNAEAATEDGPKIPYEVELTGVEDTALGDLLRGSSSLVELKDNPPPSFIGLERRADSDRERLLTALRSAGYYDAQLTVRLDPDTQPVKVSITVTTGQAYSFKTIETRTATGEPLPGGPVTPSDLGLDPGKTADAPTVVDAQSKLIAALVGRGYAFAKVTDRQVVVDHSDHSMDVTFIADPGPPIRFGPVEIHGAETLDEDLLRGRLPWKPGESYQPGLLDRGRTNLAKLGVFDMVRVQLADQPGPDGVTPVIITVAERKARFIGAGVAYSTTEGISASTYWGHRNLFGGAEQLRLGVEVGRLAGQTNNTSTLDIPDLRFSANFRKPDFLAPRQSLLLDFSVVADSPPAYERVAGIFTAALEREITDQTRASAGVTSERGRVRANGQTQQVSLIGLPLSMTYDGTDSLLDPTRGQRLGATVTPWFPLPGNESHSRFIVTSITGSTHHDFSGDGRYVGALRVGVGGITGGSLSDIPADHRFYTGGGGSVRGYGFQKAGPRDSVGDPLGGRALFEMGMEMRVKVTQNIGVVPFVDAGSVYDRSFPDFSEPLRVGAGLGLRYYTDFGPLRVDVGVPLNRQTGDSRWQLYLSLGQAF